MLHELFLSRSKARNVCNARHFLSLQLLALGEEYFADKYAKASAKLLETIFELGWDENRQLLADLPDSSIYSQHANIFGILTDAIPVEKQEEMMKWVNVIVEKRMVHQSTKQSYPGNLLPWFLKAFPCGPTSR